MTGLVQVVNRSRKNFTPAAPELGLTVFFVHRDVSKMRKKAFEKEHKNLHVAYPLRLVNEKLSSFFSMKLTND